MNHDIYMNNKYDLFKINQSFYNGWKFRIPKTIYKSCFIQILNKEYLLYNLKNIICDYVHGSATPACTNKNTSTEINRKRRRISRNKKRKIVKSKAILSTQDIFNDIKEQMSSIVIQISKNEKVHKRKRGSNSVFKRRRMMKKRIKTKYNENVIYDAKNNLLIINKKNIPNYQNDDDYSFFNNSIIKDNKSFKIIKNKEKETENSKQNKKKEEKLKFHSNNINDSESLFNKKIVKKEKNYDNNNIEKIKDINGNKNNNLNKNNIETIFDTKSTIIINNINNTKNDEISTNQGLIQINNYNLENNILNNFSNYSTKNNTKQNININKNNDHILNNNFNNNNSNNNRNYLNYHNISVFRQLPIIPLNIIQIKINGEMNKIASIILNANSFAENLIRNLEKNNIANINEYKNIIFHFFREFDEIWQQLNETEYYMINALNIMKSNLLIFHQLYFNDNNQNIFEKLLINFYSLEESALDIQKKYSIAVEFFIYVCNILRQIINNING